MPTTIVACQQDCEAELRRNMRSGGPGAWRAARYRPDRRLLGPQRRTFPESNEGALSLHAPRLYSGGMHRGCPGGGHHPEQVRCKTPHD